MLPPVFVAGVRTPICRLLGARAPLSASTLAGIAIGTLIASAVGGRVR
jgi:hypothetical protein